MVLFVVFYIESVCECCPKFAISLNPPPPHLWIGQSSSLSQTMLQGNTKENKVGWSLRSQYIFEIGWLHKIITDLFSLKRNYRNLLVFKFMTSSHSKIIYPNSASVHSTESIVFTDSAIELATWNFFFF